MAADRPLPNTPIGKTMQYRLVVLEEKLLRGKRLVMGTIVDQFGNVSLMEHSRHGSTTNFSVNFSAGLNCIHWASQEGISQTL